MLRGVGLFAGGGEPVRASRLWINIRQSLVREMCSGKSMSLGLNLPETVVREFELDKRLGQSRGGGGEDKKWRDI